MRSDRGGVLSLIQQKMAGTEVVMRRGLHPRSNQVKCGKCAADGAKPAHRRHRKALLVLPWDFGRHERRISWSSDPRHPMTAGGYIRCSARCATCADCGARQQMLLRHTIFLPPDQRPGADRARRGVVVWEQTPLAALMRDLIDARAGGQDRNGPTGVGGAEDSS